jgi:hypothetical protein
MTLSRILSGPLLVAVAAALGCSSSGNPNAPARVSGKLTYNNQPIKAGNMLLHTPDGVAYPAQISPDGTYSATDVPTGELVVTIDTEPLSPKSTKKGAQEESMRMKQMQGMEQRRPAGADPGADPTANYIKIPAKYASPKTSPVKVTLSAGKQSKDINLTD